MSSTNDTAADRIARAGITVEARDGVSIVRHNGKLISILPADHEVTDLATTRERLSLLGVNLTMGDGLTP